MRIPAVLLPLLALMCGGLALAEDDAAEDSVTGVAPAPVDARDEAVEPAPADARVAEAARALGMGEPFILACLDATNRLYARDYKGARAAFDALNRDWPGFAIQHVGAVLIYQSLMMENFDFRFEKQYLYHSGEAVKALEAGLASGGAPGARALRHFFAGAMMGVESIHVMRRGDYVPALSRGLDAMKHIDEARRLAPSFKDPLLADGLFRYWRSVVTMNSKVLPDFEDQRALGIAELQEVEAGGVFLGPGATLALAFTWIEERQLPRARRACLKNHRAFPKNVINNLVLSRVWMYERRYDESLAVLRQIEADAPDNQRVHYYYATVWLRLGELDRADAAVDRYLAFPDLDDYFRAQALHRKGDIAYRRRDFAAAEAWYTRAVKTADYKPAKAKLDRMHELKRKGQLVY